MRKNDDCPIDSTYAGAGEGRGGCGEALLLRRHITDLLDGLDEEKTARS